MGSRGGEDSCIKKFRSAHTVVLRWDNGFKVNYAIANPSIKKLSNHALDLDLNYQIIESKPILLE